MNPPVLVRRYRARADEIGRIRHDVRAHAREQGARDPEAVALAVTEAVTNAVVHAYAGAPEPGERFEVQARTGGGTRIRMAFATS